MKTYPTLTPNCSKPSPTNITTKPTEKIGDNPKPTTTPFPRIDVKQ